MFLKVIRFKHRGHPALIEINSNISKSPMSFYWAFFVLVVASELTETIFIVKKRWMKMLESV